MLRAARGRTGYDVAVGAAHQCEGAVRIAEPTRGSGGVSELGAPAVKAITPPLEMVMANEVITLGEVAPVSEDQVLDGVVRPARPRHEVIDVATAAERT